MRATVVSSSLVTAHRVADCAVPGPLEFRLREPLVVEIDGVRYRAPAGLSTDGASTPRAFRNLVPRIGRHIYGAIIHDAAYRGRLQVQDAAGSWLPHPVSREWADSVFLALMDSTGTGRLTRWMAYRAVRLFGRAAYQG